MSGPVIESINKEGYAFDFFQLARISEKFLVEKSHPALPPKIKFLTDNTIAFPPNDVVQVSITQQEIKIVVSFMGLIGVSSPLPSYFTTPISLNKDDYKALAYLLEIFSNRIYHLYFSAWKKYRPNTEPLGNMEHPYTKRIMALSGQVLNPAHTNPKLNLLQKALSARLMGTSVRSAKNLKLLLQNVFGFKNVIIKQFYPKHRSNPGKVFLGTESRLGQGTFLGLTVLDYSSSILINIKNVSVDFFYTKFFDHNQSQANIKNDLIQMIRDFLKDPIDFDIEIEIEPPLKFESKLGDTRNRLGISSWLGIQSLSPVKICL